ncbi:phenylacetate--CoA ligase family protein, partial [Serratia bockelmannii]
MSESGSFKDVRREVAYAYEKVKFFKTHMEMSGLRPDDIKTLADFKRIPVTRKLHYRRNYPSGVLAAGFTLTGPHVMRFQSSGTSGERLNSAILSYDLARRQATSMGVNANFNALWRPGARPRICRYAPPNCSDVECGIGLTTMEERTLADGTLVLPV